MGADAFYYSDFIIKFRWARPIDLNRLNESNSVLSLQPDMVPDELYTPMSLIRG